MLQTSPQALSQRYGRASLAEHLEMRLRASRQEYPLVREVMQFFELDDTELTLKELSVPYCEAPDLFRALKRCCASWQLVGEGGGDSYRSLRTPLEHRFEIRPGRFVSYPVVGSRFFRLPDGSKRGIIFSQEYVGEQSMLDATFIAPRQRKRQLSREVSAIVAWGKRHRYLRGQVIRANGTLLCQKDRPDWHGLALTTEVRAALESNIRGLLEQRKLYRKNGVPQKRGILLYGPPGTGKTMIGKALAGLGCATFIWVTAADMSSVCAVRHLFDLARKLKPTILFFEDIDLYAGERSFGNTVTLGELLSQLDGLETNDGLIAVATTNDLMAIEPAIRERPSRFDVVLEIGLPQVAARRQILADNLGRQVPDAAVLDQAAADADGLSGAQMRELAFLAVQKAIVRGDLRDDGIARLTAADFTEALQQLAGKRKQPIGFSSQV